MLNVIISSNKNNKLPRYYNATDDSFVENIVKATAFDEYCDSKLNMVLTDARKKYSSEGLRTIEVPKDVFGNSLVIY